MSKNRVLMLFVIVPLLVGTAALGQGTEKGPDVDKNTNFPESDTTSGSLLGNPTYDRIFTSDVDPG